MKSSLKSRMKIVIPMCFLLIPIVTSCSQNEVDDLNRDINELNQDLNDLQPTIDSLVDELNSAIDELEQSLNS